MRELRSFQIKHSAIGEFILLHASFTDSMTIPPSITPGRYPDQHLMIRLSEAKNLLNELKKCVDYIEAGIEEANHSIRHSA
jgi:hypothetical protein